MKAKMITAGIVLALMVALCLYAMGSVQADAEALRNLALRASAAAENGDVTQAQALLGALEASADARRAHLEILALHEDLNNVSEAASEARVRLQHGQIEEFQVAMVQILDALTLLDERQRLTWSNLF